MGCCEGQEGYCKKCRGMIGGLVGVLILINAFVWPKWLGVDGWVAFFGLLLLLAGAWRSLMPACGCHHKDACCVNDSEAPVTHTHAKEAHAKETKKKK